jgi:hypothetical protein
MVFEASEVADRSGPHRAISLLDEKMGQQPAKKALTQIIIWSAPRRRCHTRLQLSSSLYSSQLAIGMMVIMSWLSHFYHRTL